MFPNFINHLKKHVELNIDEIATLKDFVKIIEVKKKDFLLEEGKICRYNYFVEKGLLRMFFVNEKGVEQITQFALENWWMSDHMSLIMEKPSVFNIQAVENATIIAVAFSTA